MPTSILVLPPELLVPIIQNLDGGDLCSIRLASRYLCHVSGDLFVQHIRRNHYFTLDDSLKILSGISQDAYFRQMVESVQLYPHSLTWNPIHELPALAKEEVDYTRWLKHPLTSIQRENFRRELLCHSQYAESNTDLKTLTNALSNLPNLSKIEVGSWGRTLSEIEQCSKTMRQFREDTHLGLLHFDWRTIWEARTYGTRSSCDGDCSLTRDFNLILLALAVVQKPITELKVHYWSDAGLKCVQIQDVPLRPDMLQALRPSFTKITVLHLCLGFERGRQSSNEPASLTDSKTWLSDLLSVMPHLEDLKLVFDGWAQWEVRSEPSAPDWSGSIFHHFATTSARSSRLRKLDLQNMFVRWQDVFCILEAHKDTLVELSLNRMTIWSILSWDQSTPDSDAASWLDQFLGKLRTMPLLRSVNLSWLCINGRMMCFHQSNFRHCLGCDDNVMRPTDYGIRSCPHYAFGINRDVEFLQGPRPKSLSGQNSSNLKDLLDLAVVMVPMRIAFPIYYQADENDFDAEWNYYDGTVGRWDTAGPELHDL